MGVIEAVCFIYTVGLVARAILFTVAEVQIKKGARRLGLPADAFSASAEEWFIHVAAWPFFLAAWVARWLKRWLGAP